MRQRGKLVGMAKWAILAVVLCLFASVLDVQMVLGRGTQSDLAVGRVHYCRADT